MTVTNAHKLPTPKIVDFANRRLKKLVEQIHTAHDEQIMWEEVLERLPICFICRGRGEVPYQLPDSGGSMSYKKCQHCNGTGEPQ